MEREKPALIGATVCQNCSLGEDSSYGNACRNCANVLAMPMLKHGGYSLSPVVCQSPVLDTPMLVLVGGVLVTLHCRNCSEKQLRLTVRTCVGLRDLAP